MKKHYDRPKKNLRAGKALVIVTLSDSFRIWPPSMTLCRDFQKDAEQFAFPHNRLKGDSSDKGSTMNSSRCTYHDT